jgi:hypothetical protein
MGNLENEKLGIKFGMIIHYLDVLLQKAALIAERQANSKNPIFWQHIL